jgi:iron complex transport system ATP-binding protein
MLRASDVSFAYPPSRGSKAGAPVVRTVSIEIARGSLTGLLGPNGCGKTTLLKLLSGVLPCDGGTITLDGQNLRSMSRRDVARRVAVVPQETHPAFDYTAIEMVLMGRHPHLRAFQLEGPDDVVVARESLAATGTLHLADRPFMTLSGGEKQRVVIAGALAQSPDVLLLDEPTASLDLGYQLEVQELLARLNRGHSAMTTRRGGTPVPPPAGEAATQPLGRDAPRPGDPDHEPATARGGVTMVLATHDLNLAAALCDRLVLMRDGRVLASGAAADVLNAAMVRQLYDVDADVRFNERAGHLTVVPVGRRR